MIRMILFGLALLFFSCSEPVSQKSKADEAYEEQTNIYESYRVGEFGVDGMYRSTDGKFLVKFPSEPELTTEFLDTEAGKVRVDMYVYNESATQSFMVSISEFPSKHIQRIGAPALLNSAANGAIKPFENDNLAIEVNEDFTMNEMPAKRLKASSDLWNLSSEMFVVRNRLYQVTILRDGAMPEPRVEKEFIHSFHIMEKVG